MLMEDPIKSTSFLKSSDKILTIDTDDFIVGDRVWVNGSKPGYIQYIGDTKFASGEWAGVVLDDPVGKNDGSVSGKRYFYCEPNRGVFARLYRLTKYPLSGRESVDSAAYSGNSRSSTPRFDRCLTPKSNGHSLDGILKSKTSISTSTTTKMTRSTSPSRSPSPGSPKEKTVSYYLPARPAKTVTTTTTTTTTVDNFRPGPLRVGDKVFVNSSKGVLSGLLRYLGKTDFAPGHWAGVELDQRVGKNDGSVAGTRYFTCPHKYGLFTPAYKAYKADPKKMTTMTRVTRASPEI